MIDRGNVKLPPIELAWRAYRRDRLASVEPFVRESVFYPFVCQSRAEAWEAMLTPDADGADQMLQHAEGLEYIAMRGYAEDKRIYRPDHMLIESLMDVAVKPETPMALFKGLPSLTVGIELPRRTAVGVFTTREFLVSLYDVKPEEMANGPRTMAILANFGPEVGFRPITVLDLRETFRLFPTASYSNQEPVLEIRESGEVGIDSTAMMGAAESLASAYHSPTIKMVHLILNLLLYMLGSDDLVTIIRAQRKNLAKREPREAQRIRELQDPHVFGVGAKWGKAIQHWIAEMSLTQGGPKSGRHVAPHIRAAHPHLYWTGPGRTTPVVKFLLPISVKGATIPKESEGILEAGTESVPTIQVVR